MNPNTIPFNALDREAAYFKAELLDAFESVVDSGWFCLGPHYTQFCRDFAAYCGTDHCVGVANGTDAIELALRAVGVQQDDEVITVANAGMYSATAIRAIGGIPVYIDINPDDHLMDVSLVEQAITRKTKAIVATHLYGALVDMDALRLIAKKHAIKIVEDCAQAHGASKGTAKAGSMGHAAAFSFYPTKNLGALGDGGAVLTSDPAAASRVKALAQYGWSNTRYLSEVTGGRNSRLDEMQAAFLKVKLVHLDNNNTKRVSILHTYAKACNKDLVRMVHGDCPSTVAHLAVAECAQRDLLIEHMANHGVSVAVHYPNPDHMQPSLQNHYRAGSTLAVTERVCEKIITLPCHPYMNEDEIAAVAHALQTFE